MSQEHPEVRKYSETHTRMGVYVKGGKCPLKEFLVAKAVTICATK